MTSSVLSDQENLLAWNSLIIQSDLSAIQHQLKKGDIFTKDKLGKYGLSPLHLAAWHNKPEICEFLI